MKKLSLCFLTIALIGQVSIVSAQKPSQEDWQKIQQKLEEAMTKEFDKAFVKIDLDGNGVISFDEYKDYIVRQAENNSRHSFNKIDSNKDQNITKEEYMNMTSHFNKFFQKAVASEMTKQE